MIFFEIYSTNNWQYLGKFLSQGRGPDEFLSVQFSQDYFFLKMTIWFYGSRMGLYKNGHY